MLTDLELNPAEAEEFAELLEEWRMMEQEIQLQRSKAEQAKAASRLKSRSRRR